MREPASPAGLGIPVRVSASALMNLKVRWILMLVLVSRYTVSYLSAMSVTYEAVESYSGWFVGISSAGIPN